MGSQRCGQNQAEKRKEIGIPIEEEETSSVRENKWVVLSWLQRSRRTVTLVIAHQVQVEATQKAVISGSHEQKQKDVLLYLFCLE